MGQTVSLNINLDAFVRRDTRKRWVAICPAIGVASQGNSLEDAKRALDEAVQGWFESCIERGVLERALQEANFKRVPYGEAPPGAQVVTVKRTAKRDDIWGDAFRVKVAIPAYQAAALSGASA